MKPESEMTKPESEMTKLTRDVIRRQANGKTIWQPRIECWYSDRRFRKEPLPGRFEGCSEVELFNKLGVSNRLYMFNACYEQHFDSSIKQSERKIDEMTHEYIMETPVGTVNMINRQNSSNYGKMPLKWWVETEEDLKVWMYIEENTHYTFNRATYDRLYEETGHLGLPCCFLPRTTIQRLLNDLSGVENTYYLLYDNPKLVEEYFKILNKSQMQLIDLLAQESPFEWVNYGDNVHSKVTPPELFKKYLIPAYQERNERLQAAGIFTHAHFDGDNKENLPYIRECGLNGVEAVTPLPQGDVTLKEVKAVFKDDIFLIDGVDAILFSENYPLEQLKAQVDECLNLFEGQLVLGISDEMASDGTLDRIEYVRDWVNEFNAKH